MPYWREKVDSVVKDPFAPPETMATRKQEQEQLDALERVVGSFPNGVSVDEIADRAALPISRRTLQRRLGALVEAERIKSEGHTRALRYRLAASVTPVPLQQPTAAAVPLSKSASAPLREVTAYDPHFLERYEPNRVRQQAEGPMTGSGESIAFRGSVRPRPIRFAYLVSDGEHAHEILDAIFADSHSRWGGRYSLVIPCEAGKPSPEYLPWLQAYDPDVIYSYVALSDETVRDLHERFCPSRLMLHETFPTQTPADPHFYQPGHRIEALSSLSTALQYARAFPASAPRPALIVDYLPGQPPDRFIDDNFGSHYGSFGRSPMPENLGDVLQPLTVASEERLKDPRSGFRSVGPAVYDTPALLDFMAKQRNTFGVAQLASDSTPRIDVTDHAEASFSLVVGSSFDDRIMFWNDRSRMPTYLGREFAALIVPPERLEDETFFKALVAFLKSRNSVSRSNSTPWVILRSASLSREQLSELQARFRAADRWNAYHLDRGDHPRPRVPTEAVLRDSGRLVTGVFFDSQPTWKDFAFQGPSGRPPATSPHHLEGSPASLATRGGWAIDVQIARESLFGKSFWYLPRRLRMHGTFKVEGNTGMQRICRSNRQGHLALIVDNAGDIPVITVPTDEEAFSYALQQGRDWEPFKRASREWHPSGPYAYGRPSDKGRYLIGALRLFGGAEAAAQVLLHAYWKDVFESLGSNIGEARIEAIKSTLKKKHRAGELKTEDDWERLARVVASEARQVRIPRSSVDFDELKNRFAPFLERERAILAEHETAEPEEWIEHAEATLPRSVKYLASSGVLHQGCEWRCRACYHINWNAVDALRPRLICEVCGTDFAVPVERPWNFRLNGFVLEGLKEHGLLPLVWAIKKLAWQARHSFYFLPPHELFDDFPKKQGTKPNREVDLICVVDGVVHLVEAKSSLRSIELETTVDAAKRIRPDIVTLALMKPSSKALSAKLKELQELLAGTGIDAKVLTLADGDIDDHVFLP